MPKKKERLAGYYTVGVRFLDGTRVHQVYTYRVHNRHKVSLGQELIADTDRGSVVVVAVRIDHLRQDTNFNITYKYLTRKVAPL